MSTVLCLPIRSLFALLAIATFLGQGQAQSPQCSIRGRVLDPTRAPIAGAQVTVLRDGASSGASAVSDQVGEFSFLVEPGSYSLKVVAEGFQEISRPVSVTQTASEQLEFALQIAQSHN